MRIERAVVCGGCECIALAEAHSNGVLTFPLDAHIAWKGWRRASEQAVSAPGGIWHVAPDEIEKQPPLYRLIELLPAIVQCPGCGAGNLLDALRLQVQPTQVEARGARTGETTMAS